MPKFLGIAVKIESHSFCIDQLAAYCFRDAVDAFERMRPDTAYCDHTVYTIDQWTHFVSSMADRPEVDIRKEMESQICDDDEEDIDEDDQE
jgi:hypothetical protein